VVLASRASSRTRVGGAADASDAIVNSGAADPNRELYLLACSKSRLSLETLCPFRHRLKSITEQQKRETYVPVPWTTFQK
jgi:hypothetical protein